MCLLGFVFGYCRRFWAFEHSGLNFVHDLEHVTLRSPHRLPVPAFGTMETLRGKTFLVSSREHAEECTAALIALGAVCVGSVAVANSSLFEIAAVERECCLVDGCPLVPPERRMSPIWLGYQERSPSMWLPPEASPLFRPVRSYQGIPRMRELVITLDDGLDKEMHDFARLLVLSIGCKLRATLSRERTTHLVCDDSACATKLCEEPMVTVATRWKTEGSRASPIHIVSLRWLSDCIEQWKLLPEEAYTIRPISGLPARSGQVSAKGRPAIVRHRATGAPRRRGGATAGYRGGRGSGSLRGGIGRGAAASLAHDSSDEEAVGGQPSAPRPSLSANRSGEEALDSSDEESAAAVRMSKVVSCTAAAEAATMARPWLLDHDLVGRRARCFRSSESGWRAVDGTIRGWRPILESVGNAGLAEWRVVLDPDGTDSAPSSAADNGVGWGSVSRELLDGTIDESLPESPESSDEEILEREATVQAVAAYERQLTMPWALALSQASWACDVQVDPAVWKRGHWITCVAVDDQTPKAISERCQYDCTQLLKSNGDRFTKTKLTTNSRLKRNTILVLPSHRIRRGDAAGLNIHCNVCEGPIERDGYCCELCDWDVCSQCKSFLSIEDLLTVQCHRDTHRGEEEVVAAKLRVAIRAASEAKEVKEAAAKKRAAAAALAAVATAAKNGPSSASRSSLIAARRVAKRAKRAMGHELESEAGDVPQCEKGHPLAHEPVAKECPDLLSCDRCDCELPVGTWSYCCNECDLDICMQCVLMQSGADDAHQGGEEGDAEGADAPVEALVEFGGGDGMSGDERSPTKMPSDGRVSGDGDADEAAGHEPDGEIGNIGTEFDSVRIAARELDQSDPDAFAERRDSEHSKRSVTDERLHASDDLEQQQARRRLGSQDAAEAEPPPSAVEESWHAAEAEFPLSAVEESLHSAEAEPPPSALEGLWPLKRGCEQGLRVIQIVGGSDEDTTRIQAAADRLGGATLVEGQHFDLRCTHVVAVTLKRTEKTLSAISAGKWLLNVDWLHASLAEGAWQPEVNYEIFGDETCEFGKGTLWLGAPRQHRLRRESGQDGPFAGRLFVVGQGTQPAPEVLGKILTAGGATVCTSDGWAHAELVAAAIVKVGATRTTDALVAQAWARAAPCVPPEFVIEQLTQREPRGLAMFALTEDQI